MMDLVLFQKIILAPTVYIKGLAYNLPFPMALLNFIITVQYMYWLSPQICNCSLVH